MPFLRAVSALALAAWVGSMLFFAVGVAPVAFSVLPDRVLAGNVVNGSMACLHALGLTAGGVLVVALALRARLAALRRPAFLKLALALAMLGATAYSAWGISAPLAAIRAEVGAIDSLPPGDPTRDRFARLHRLSVGVMGATLVMGALLVVLEQRAETR